MTKSVIDCYLSPEIVSGPLKWTRVLQCFIVACLLAPFCVFGAAFMVICRLLVTIHFKVVHEGKYTLCSPSDSAFAYEKRANLITITLFTFVRGKTNIDKLRERVYQRIEKYETEDGRKPLGKLTWKLLQKYGFYTWETNNDMFDVRDHIKTCPEIDCNTAYSEDEVQQIGERFLDEPLNSKRPLWEILFIPNVKMNTVDELDGLESSSHYSLIIRVHHAYMDGPSLLQVLDKVLFDVPGKLYIDPVHPPIPNLSTIERIGLYLQAFFMGPYSCFQTLGLKKDNIFQDMSENVGPKYSKCSNKEITLESVQAIRNKFNCSTMAIFSSTVTGALRRAAKRKNLIIPDGVTFAITLAVLPYPNDDPQNRFIVRLLQSPMCVSDPVKRLSTLHSAIKSIEPHEVIALRAISLLVGLLPCKAIELIYRSVSCGFAVTNLPGYQEKLQIFGDNLERIYGSPPIQTGLGFGVGFCSFNGKIHVAWLAEKSKIISNRKDMTELIEAFDEELSQLEYIANGNDKYKPE